MFKLFNFTSNQQLDVCTLQMGISTEQWSKTHINTGFEMDKATSIMHLEWPT